MRFSFARILLLAAAVLACGALPAWAMGGIPIPMPGPYLYMSRPSSNAVTLLDSRTGQILTNTLSVTNPLSSAVRGDQAFAYFFNGTNVSVVNTGTFLQDPMTFDFYSTATVTTTFTTGTGANPVGGAVSIDGRKLYVVSGTTGDVRVVDTSNNSVLNTISVGANPFLAAMSPDGQKLYVGNSGSSTISVINTATNLVVGTIGVGSTPQGMAISRDSSKIYVANSGGNTVSVINASTQAVSTTITVGANPSTVTFSYDGTTAYVTNRGGDSLSIIDVASDTVTSTVSTGAGSAPSGAGAIPAFGTGLSEQMIVIQGGTNTYSFYDPSTGILTSSGQGLGAGPPQFPAMCANGNAHLTAGNTFIARTGNSLYCSGAEGVQFNGGTLQIEAVTFLPRPLTLLSGGGTINTNGSNVTLGDVVTGVGGLTKNGTGNLQIENATSYLGATQLNAGSIIANVNPDVLAPASSYTLAAGTAMDISNTTQTIGGLGGAGNVDLTNATLTLGGNNQNTAYSGALGGAGGILVKNGTGKLTLSGTSTYTGATTVNSGLLTVNGTISASASLTINNGGSVGGSGTLPPLVILNNGASIAPGNSIGTLNLPGSASFNVGSIYVVEADNLGNADKIIAAGNVTINGGTVSVQAATGTYQASTQYTIITSTGGTVTGTFTNVTSNLAFLTPSLSYNSKNVILTLTSNIIPPPVDAGGGGGGGGSTPPPATTTPPPTTGLTSFCAAAITQNQCNVANAIQAGGAGRGVYDNILAQSVDGARTGFDALSGEIHAGIGTLLFEDSRYIRAALLARMRAANDDVPMLAVGGPASTEIEAAPLPAQSYQPVTFWMQGFGAWGRFPGDGNAATMARALDGVFAGMDRRVEGWRIGLAGGYAHAQADIDARQSHADTDSYVIAGYANGSIFQLQWRSGASYSWHHIRSARSITFPGLSETARTSYNANTGQVFGEIGYPLPVLESAVEPFAGLAYVFLNSDAFAEDGGKSALQAAARDGTIGYTTLGLRVGAVRALNATTRITPHLSAAWQHAIGSIDQPTTLAFRATGEMFNVMGVPLGRDAALIDAGLGIALAHGMSFDLSYNGSISPTLVDHAIKGKFNWHIH